MLNRLDNGHYCNKCKNKNEMFGLTCSRCMKETSFEEKPLFYEEDGGKPNAKNRNIFKRGFLQNDKTPK